MVRVEAVRPVQAECVQSDIVHTRGASSNPPSLCQLFSSQSLFLNCQLQRKSAEK